MYSVRGQRFDSKVVVGIDADFARDRQRFAADGFRIHLGVAQQTPGSGLGERTAGTDRDQIVFGLDDIAIAGNDQRSASWLATASRASRRLSKRSVRQSLASSTAARVKWPECISKLGFKKRSNSVKSIGCPPPGKTGDDLVLVQSSHLAGVGLHDRIAQRDLAVAGDHDLVAAPDRKQWLCLDTVPCQS